MSHAIKNRALRPVTFKERAFDELIRKSWWVLLLFGAAYVLHAHGMHKKEQTLADLKLRLAQLLQEKEGALQEREDLLLQLKSQNDPAWIEMILMKGLGVVPEGQTKVYFKKSP